MRKFAIISTVAMLWAPASDTVLGRTALKPADKEAASAAQTPGYCNVAHNVGKIGLGISNDGTIGTQFAVLNSYYDCFTGELLPSCEYPIGSRTSYLFGGALWIGAVTPQDTLVSTGADGWARAGNEFHPDEFWTYPIIYRSTIDPDAPWAEGAVSEQDYIAKYSDTCRTCSGVTWDWSGRQHLPLNVEVTQSSYAWSLPHAEDFVLIDYAIKNIGSEPLNGLYTGLYLDNDIYDAREAWGGAQDDLSGMWTGSQPIINEPGCPGDVNLEIAWSADNDGDLDESYYTPLPNVTGLRMLRFGASSTQVSFNWWVGNQDPSLDYGPMRRAALRDFGTGGMGTPEGDRNKYYLLSNGDIDYDQCRIATISDNDTIWIPPQNDPVRWIATGSDTRYLLSFGPVTLDPGESTPFTIAYVAGEDFHTDPANFDNLPLNPDGYLAGLNFDDFLTNGVWAGWVFDNPGVDTDSDGYFGEYQICEDDTVWIAGDGVPDWRASTPPVAPSLWVEPRDSALYVRWNGFTCEILLDWASRQRRFEGYHAYLSTYGGPGSYSRVASYDREDYYKYYWDFELTDWIRTVPPLGVEEARCQYAPSGCNDYAWHPLDYTRQAPYVMPGHTDSLFYFLPCLANASRFGVETPFLKRFPLAPKPAYLSPQDVPSDSIDFYLTPDGHFKYYEYEYTIGNLVPGLAYWVSITSFDYGSMLPGADPAESGITQNALKAYPLGACCHGIVGNANCDPGEELSIGDIVAMVDFLFISQMPLCCVAEADINQTGGSEPTAADISISDVTILIDYLFITGASLGMPECR